MAARTDTDLPGSDGPRLARLFSVDLEPVGEWTPEEYGALWRHQLGQSISGHSPHRIWDVFRAPEPPLDWLITIKNFAKANRTFQEPRLPQDIAAALYYVAIAAALVKRGTQLSRLSELELGQAFAWVRAQSWLDDHSRGLLVDALTLLDAPQ